jgi:hypothetical protein
LKKLPRRNLSLVAVAALYGCSSVTMMDGSEGQVTEGTCDVKVYQTRAQALKGGEIDELCVITGTSMFSFVHTYEVAVSKHKDKACACGGNAVYIESRSPPAGFNGPATVSMIAFRYVKGPSATYQQQSTPHRTDQSTRPMGEKSTNTAIAADAETAKVVQFLADDGFPVVGVPVLFKQKDNLSYYEARGSGNQITQVVCEAGMCRTRKFYE